MVFGLKNTKEMKSKGYWVLKGLKFAVMGAAFVALAGFAVMGLWNWLMPAIFGLGVINWLQAVGLLVLSKIFFGGRGWGGGGRWGGRHGCGGGHGRHEHWRQKFEERWANMSEEEKAKMKSRWGGRCGGWPEEQPKQEDKAAS
jgi:hypothetical protein